MTQTGYTRANIREMYAVQAKKMRVPFVCFFKSEMEFAVEATNNGIVRDRLYPGFLFYFFLSCIIFEKHKKKKLNHLLPHRVETM